MTSMTGYAYVVSWESGSDEFGFNTYASAREAREEYASLDADTISDIEGGRPCWVAIEKVEMLDSVGLPTDSIDRFEHQGETETVAVKVSR